MRLVIILTIIAFAIITNTLADPWKFAVLADCDIIDKDDNVSLGSTADVLGKLANDLKHQDIDFIIFCGDLAERENHDSLDDILTQWKSQMKPLYDSGIAVYTVRGNHERYDNQGSDSTDPYLSHFPLAINATSPDGGYTYEFTHKNAKFIGFDQYINRKPTFGNYLYFSHSNEGEMMNPWVISQINNSTSPLNFAFAHEPLFPSQSHPDCMANDPDSRDALVTALGTHHGAYFSGHDHMYLRGIASDGKGDSVPEFVVGTAGSPIYNYAPYETLGYTGADSFSVEKVYGNSNRRIYGYLLVTVFDNNTWSGQFRGYEYNIAGANKNLTVLDSFELTN